MTLEQFILDHLEELNQATPDQKIWKQLLHRLDEGEMIDFIAKHREDLEVEGPNGMLWERLLLALEDAPVEQFIEDNKSFLDTEEPPAGLWDRIDDELSSEEVKTSKIVEMTPKKSVSIKVVWQMAASFLLLLISALFFQHWYLNNNTETTAEAPTITIEEQIANIAPELVEAESYYSQQISQKLVQLRSMDLADTGIDLKGFEEEIASLDKVYAQMKTDLVDSQANERVLQAMIENLQIRMELLNRQLQILEKVNQLKTDEDHDIQI